ncbi:MAG: bifunctional demethylmenaquinone methyltransferase/2-methoxy-6-polyprenyl-1,4-benzoquinol methylase UbiE [Thermoleophilia bacterium]|nr:bifunctional demethylmenaquinone methyltransferase/2-methoxy-6-polyprenyl-1,4-benzoquinol methylase UbiE [Thermoleophilia bacterium]
MFGGIARRYDLMNTIMTAGMHHRWRRLGVRLTGLRPGDSALDVCCGTGDFAFTLIETVGPMGSVTGIDFSRRMLEVAREKSRSNGKPVDFRWGDANAIEFDDDYFDAATVGFGVRNIKDTGGVFSEMARVVKPGGRVVCLEITQPSREPFKSFYGVWFDRLVPTVGRLVGKHDSAYTYLPSSVRRFPPAPALKTIMEEAGLKDVGYRLLAGSIIAIHWGTA